MCVWLRRVARLRGRGAVALPPTRSALVRACLLRRGRVLSQVVDYDYRGEVGVILFNHSETDFAGALLARHAKLRW